MRKASIVLGVVTVLGFASSEALAHGFSPPPSPPGVGRGLTGGGNPTSSNTPNTNTGARPAPAGFTPGTTAREGGTTGGSRGGGMAPRAGAATARRDRNGAEGGGDSGAPETAAEATALGTAFKTAITADMGRVKDRSVSLDVSCLDAALRKVEFRVKVAELRGSDIKRRIEVQEKSGADYVTREVFFMRESGAMTKITRWTKDGGTASASSLASEIRLNGTPVTLADVVPFDATAYSFTFTKAAEVDFVTQETYTVKPSADNGVSGSATFRSDLRVPTHTEWSRGGVRTRGYDYTGWRFASGITTPSRVSVLGASLEPVATIDVKDAQINTGLKADVFEPSKASGSEVASGAK